MTLPHNEVDRDHKVMEARAAILLQNEDAHLNRNDLTFWILENLFRPITTRDYNQYKILYLSSNAKSLWERKKKDPRRNAQSLIGNGTLDDITPSNSMTTSDESYLPAPSPSPSANLSEKEKMYIITPGTKLLMAANKHSMVYMVDLSSSLATIEAGTSTVMIGNTYKILENIIHGLIQPFTLNPSDLASNITIPQIIRITVIAECSQFGSNMNIIPLMAEYPTMRVLLQNIKITQNNITAVLRVLKDSLDLFEKDLAKFRKKISQRRSKMGYELDVRGDHTQTEEGSESGYNLSQQAVEISYFNNDLSTPLSSHLNSNNSSRATSKRNSVQKLSSYHHSRTKSGSSKHIKNNSSNRVDNISIKKASYSHATTFFTPNLHHEGYHHDGHHHKSSSVANSTNTKQPTKDTWGVGKTGSTLSYILRAGIFALNLLPKEGLPSIILVTDGVVKSNIQDESIVKQLTSENIACSVVLVGPEKAFLPGINFGFVPDHEILEFLAYATNGNFMYAHNCPSIPPIQPINEHSPDTVDFPNVYHYRFLFRETFLDRASNYRSNRSKEDLCSDNSNKTESLNDNNKFHNPMVNNISIRTMLTHYDRRIFPWDPYAAPIMEDIGLLRYKELTPSADCWYYMRVRLRQGFVLYSISFDEPRGSNNNSKPGSSNNAGSLSTLSHKKERVTIIFLLRWKPNIMVEYRIRSIWSSSLRQYLKNIAMKQERSFADQDLKQFIDEEKYGAIFHCMKAPKAEILVRATKSFTEMLHNWDSFQRRSQMMAVQGAKSKVDLNGAPGLVKVGKMKRFLEKLVDSDSMLKQLLQLDPYDKGHSNSNAIKDDHVGHDKYPHKLSYVQRFKSLWSKMERSEMRSFNSCWYDELQFNVIIGFSSSSSIYNNIRDSGTDEMRAFDSEFDETRFALNRIHSLMESWSTLVSDDQQVYIKMLNIVDGGSLNRCGPEEPSTPISLNSKKRNTLPQFCEVRLIKETENVIQIKLMFFNVDITERHKITENLKSMLLMDDINRGHTDDTLASLEVRNHLANGLGIDHFKDIQLIITQKPLSNLMMRDPSHYLNFDMDNNISKRISTISANMNLTVSNKASLQSNPALLLTGEFIVKNYLQQHSWDWDVKDIHTDKQSHKYLTPIINLSFEYISSIRIEQKWNLISFNKNFNHFYKEVENSSGVVYSIQYFIWRDITKKKITTEIWLEPLSSETTPKSPESVLNRIFDEDRQLLTQLLTFDIMYSFGQHYPIVETLISNFLIQSDRNSLHNLINSTEQVVEAEDETRPTVKHMSRSSLFNLSSILRLGTFLFASYPCPNYSRHFHPQTDNKESLNLVVPTPKLTVNTNIPLETIHEPSEVKHLYINRRNPNISGNSIMINKSRPLSKFSPATSPHITTTPLLWNTDKRTTCTCTRPDELFCSQKDEISRLQPVLRDVALLHYYIEQSLSVVADRSMSLKKTPVDDFWATLIKELFQMEEVGAFSTTLHIAPNLRDLKCFIKIFDPTVFVAILVPRLDAIVKGLSSSGTGMKDKANIGQQFNKMSLMVFECHRQAPGNCDERFILKSQPIKIKAIDATSSKEWLESLGSTLRPTLSRGYMNTISDNEHLSDRTLRLMQNVTQVYSRSFVKSIFTCLLHGRAVDSEDFEKVLEICDESNIDIDLTGYLNVQTLLKKRSQTSEEELASVNQRFVSVLGHYFEPVIISNSKWSNMYCYRPPFAKVGQKLGLSLSSGEKPSNLADVVVCAQNPLYVRLDCSLRKPCNNIKGYTEITFPLRNLPVLYEGETEDGQAYNFEPDSIGTIYSPVGSADGTTATLHLVCMTLPQSEYDPPNALFSHRPECPADSTTHNQGSFLDTEKSHRVRLPSLSQDKQDALVETEARLTWLFTEEIMHGLLRSGPITENEIRYIEAQLKKKNHFVDFPTTAFIPLTFVKNQKESRRTFFEELEKVNNTPYRLIRVGDCFYASDNGTSTTTNYIHKNKLTDSETELSYDVLGLNITTEEKKGSQSTTPGEQGSDELCQGLGISILEPDIADDESMLTISKVQEPTHPQLYWLLLIPQAFTVQIYFYSKMQQFVNRTEIIRVTKTMVNEVMERTNKLSLLQHLHDTRICSKYLLAPVEGEKINDYSSADESSSDDERDISTDRDNLVEILSTSGEEAAFSPPKKFIPGQFSCNIVFTKRFPLHWRLPPNSAFTKLMNDTLPPFLVRNKPGMFVCSHQKSVVYCLLYEMNAFQQISAATDHFNSDQIFSNSMLSDFGNSEAALSYPDSPFPISSLAADTAFSTSHSRVRYSSHVYNKQSPQGSMISDRHSPRTSPVLTDTIHSPAGKKLSKLTENRELVLEVYGVEADTWIIDGLVDMIESRITSDITLKEVQQFLVRNPTSKLSRADIDFILPVDKEPALHKVLYIPSLIEETAQFLKLFKKNLLIYSYIQAINSTYLPQIIKRHQTLRYSQTADALNQNKKNEDWNGVKPTTDDFSCVDFSFYYNYLSRAPGSYSSFEQKVNEGVAGITISVLNQNGLILGHIANNSATQPITSIEMLDDCFQSDFTLPDELNQSMRIEIDIWTHCKINVNELYNYIFGSFRQSICDYLTESIIYIPSKKYLTVDTEDSNSKESLSADTCSSFEESDDKKFESMAALLEKTLKKSIEWQSSSVRYFSKSIDLAPWYFNDIIVQLKNELIDTHPNLKPIVSRAPISHRFNEEALTNEGVFELCHEFTDDRTYHSSKKGSEISKEVESSGYPKKTKQVPIFDHCNYRYLVISGLPDLYNKLYSPVLGHFRQNSSDGLRMIGQLSTNQTDDEISIMKKESMSIRRDDASFHSRQESMASSISKNVQGFLPKQRNEYKEISHRHSFVAFMLDSLSVSIYAYNCAESFSEHIFNNIYRNIIHQETRHLGLNNILHQKMGLFYHTDKFSDIIPRTENVTTNISLFAPPAPLQHSIVTQIQNGIRAPMSPSVVNTIGRLVQMDTAGPSTDFTNQGLAQDQRINNKGTITPTSSNTVVTFENLKQLIKPAILQDRSKLIGNQKKKAKYSQDLDGPPSIFDVHDNGALCQPNKNGGVMDIVYTAVRSADANTLLRDVYADSTADFDNRDHPDYLYRHGEPFLNMYLRRSQPLAAHEKAFKVYSKWAEQYYAPGHTRTTEEMMTVAELKLILKASRLLHFCRTPLIFSETISADVFHTNSEFERLFNKTIVSKSDEMTQWYEKLSQGFMGEYAAYLKSIGMHLIVSGPSNDQEDERIAYLSRFKITDDYSVNSPVVYLLQVFSGGSIMCEVRLTDAFVSVTLYTLHRRYGRLQYSPYSHQKTEVGRANFQSFMGECDQFKQRIHVNSFVFDFHLRYIQRSLDDVDSLPSDLNLLSVIKNTIAVYDRPAIYSRNRIINGIYEFSVEEPLNDIIPWLLSSGSKLGLKTLKVDTVPIACFASSDDLSFDIKSVPDTSSDLTFRFTLIVCPAETSSPKKQRNNSTSHRQGSFDLNGASHIQKIIGHAGKNNVYDTIISLQYFIIITYRGMDRCTSFDQCQRAWSEVLKEKPERFHNFLDEVLSPRMFTMNNVFEAAKNKMDSVVNKSIYLFRREIDWNKLYEIVNTRNDQEYLKGLVSLTSRFSPIDVCAIDPSFEKFLLLKSIKWNDLLHVLKLFYPMTCGEIRVRETRHVFLFIPKATTPAFFHFISKSNERCSVTINTKEKRQGDNEVSLDERNYISQLGNTLNYYIWKHTHY
ncbi:hypothetical protein BDB01DRAFT_902076 [Pilobolus umbonatus]|nr:hypothetical protein BDB01DRAFT_902076 [Pilobolus umbonatus]